MPGAGGWTTLKGWTLFCFKDGFLSSHKFLSSALKACSLLIVTEPPQDQNVVRSTRHAYIRQEIPRPVHCIGADDFLFEERRFLGCGQCNSYCKARNDLPCAARVDLGLWDSCDPVAISIESSRGSYARHCTAFNDDWICG